MKNISFLFILAVLISFSINVFCEEGCDGEEDVFYSLPLHSQGIVHAKRMQVYQREAIDFEAKAAELSNSTNTTASKDEYLKYYNDMAKDYKAMAEAEKKIVEAINNVDNKAYQKAMNEWNHYSLDTIRVQQQLKDHLDKPEPATDKK